LLLINLVTLWSWNAFYGNHFNKKFLIQNIQNLKNIQ